MNRNDVEREVVQLLRQTALSGSDREISTRDPLGELGLGLDSLALVQFATAVETHFKLELSDAIWTERGKLTLQHFIDLIVNAKPVTSEIGQGHSTMSPISSNPDIEKQPLVKAKRQRWLATLKNNLAASYFLKGMTLLFERETYHILERELVDGKLPAYVSSLNLVLRQASVADAAALCAFWDSFRYYTLDRKKMNMQLFQTRLNSGWTCLVAWLNDAIIGVDWLLEKGYYCPHTGLMLDWSEDACYAGELFEHKIHQGKGVGLALLGFSLVESQKKGYRRQVTLVTAKNVKMLSAAMQLYGFKKTGEIHTTRIFQQPSSTWTVKGRSGRGGTLIL